MSVPSFRAAARDPREPVLHELDPVRVDGQAIPIRVAVRRLDDGSWRGRLLFGDPDLTDEGETAEILRAQNEEDFWRSVAGLREHHLRDLYRSLL